MSEHNHAHFIAGQAGVIPLSLGIPGVAKTATHQALAEATGRQFRALMLDQCLPEDLGGYPVVRSIQHGGEAFDAMAKVHDERFVRCRLEPSILLIDELTNCGHSTQAAALQLMAEGIEGCWVFAAANPIDKAAAGVDLTPPMVNRLCVLEWETDRESVLAGWRRGLHFPTPAIPVLPDNWRDYCRRWGTLLAMFVEHFPELLEAFPTDLAKASEPYPTPRSWTNVGKLLAAAESVGASEEVQAKLVYGCVGLGAGSQFLKWLEQQGLPDPEWLLSNPGRLALPRRGDMAIAILSSVLKGRGGMRGWANDVLNPRVDLKAKLLRAVRKTVEFASGAGDYSYRRPNRRNPRPDVVLPSSVQPIPRVTVIVDTSGSMDQRDLGLSLGLIGKVLNGFRIRDGLRVICGDESIGSVGKVFSPRQVELAGGGGTDMRPLILEAAESKPRPGVIVVCTDGYTPWPSEPVGVPVVACITHESAMHAVPAWMDAVCLQ